MSRTGGYGGTTAARSGGGLGGSGSAGGYGLGSEMADVPSPRAGSGVARGGGSRAGLAGDLDAYSSGGGGGARLPAVRAAGSAGGGFGLGSEIDRPTAVASSNGGGYGMASDLGRDEDDAAAGYRRRQQQPSQRVSATWRAGAEQRGVPCS